MSNFENNCLLQNSFLRNDREQTWGTMREYIFLFLFLSFLFSSNKRISTFISRLVNQIHVSHEWLHTRISDYWKFSGCNWIQRTKPIEKRGIGLLLIESAYLTDALINALPFATRRLFTPRAWHNWVWPPLWNELCEKKHGDVK